MAFLFSAGVPCSSAPCFCQFFVRSFGGWTPALSVGFSSRSALASFLWRWRSARAAVPRFSGSLFGRLFPRGSLRWLASFSVRLFVYQGNFRLFRFSSPALLPRAGDCSR